MLCLRRDFGGVGEAVWGLCAVRFVSGDGVAQPHVSEFELVPPWAG
jgi:hypothetical protein